MEANELREKVLEIVGKEPGVTLNGIFKVHLAEKLNNKFPPFYQCIKKLKAEGVVKVDGKKKNTGHYLSDVDIPDNVPQPGSPPKGREKKNEFYRNPKKISSRYLLEKNESGPGSENWRVVDSNDIADPVNKLFENCVRLVPGVHYRVRDSKEGGILHERIPDHRLTETIDRTDSDEHVSDDITTREEVSAS